MELRRITATLPIWRMEGQFYAHVSFVDVSVPAVMGKEAPVVMRWRQGDLAHFRGNVFEYRSFGGRLYAPLGGLFGPMAEDLEVVAKRSAMSTDVHGTIKDILMTGYLQHPLNVSIVKTMTRAGSIDGVKGDWARKAAPGIESDLLAIEGRLWVASGGPLLEIKWNQEARKFPPFVLNNRETTGGYIDRSHLVLSAARLEESIDLLTEYYGEVSIEGEPPTIVDPGFVFEDSVERTSVERAVWHFLWESRNKQLSAPDARHLSSIVRDAREILSARWPGVQLRFDARKHQDVATHLKGRTVPPVDDLAPLLDRIVEDAAASFPESLIRNWGFARHRAHAAMMRNAQTDGLDDFHL